MKCRTPSRTAFLLATALTFSPMAALPVLAQTEAPAITLPSFAPLVKAAKPAVVTVMVKGSAAPAQAPGPEALPGPMREFFERFGGQIPMPQQRQRRVEQGIGSGFIVDADGIIVTNNHVVEGASEIIVRLDDGRELEATLLGRDDKVDIAVLQVEGSEFPVLEWGVSDTAEIGDWAMAIGNPFGLGGTVTTGIVSARGRDIGSGPYDDYIQVDAAINKGNSGGPLLDLNGKVIGVNTAIFSPTGGSVGLGFAIPSEQAQEIVAELIEDGSVERGWIGVRIQPVTDEIADSLGLAAADGALVVEVTEGSPAEEAGLKPGDVITTFGSSDVDELRDLTRAVAKAEIGYAVEMSVWRSGAAETVEIAPALLETASLAASSSVVDPAGMGLKLRPLALEEQEALGIQEGLIITGVESGSAAEAGLSEGDVLLSVNQRAVTKPGDLAEAVEAARAANRNALLLQVLQNGTPRFLTVPLPVS